jgi:hypothetical protein
MPKKENVLPVDGNALLIYGSNDPIVKHLLIAYLVDELHAECKLGIENCYIFNLTIKPWYQLLEDLENKLQNNDDSIIVINYEKDKVTDAYFPKITEIIY